MGLMSEALNPIKILGKQAVSYTASVGRAGIRLSGAITKDALSHGLANYAIGGAIAGGALGGADNYTDRGTRGIVGATLRGAALGAAGGAAIRMGMSGYGMRGSRAARSFMGRMGGKASLAGALKMGSRNYATPARHAMTDLGTLVNRSASDMMAASSSAGRSAGYGAVGAAGRAYGAAQATGSIISDYAKSGGPMSSVIASAHVGAVRAMRSAKKYF